MIGLPSLSNMVSSFQNRDIASMGSASMEAGGSVTTGQTPASPAVEPPMQDTVTISDAALTRSKQIDEIIIEESTPSTIESRMADIKRFGWGATEEPSDGEEHYIAFSSELGANGSAEISGSSAGISGNIGAAVGIGAEGEFAYDGGRVSGEFSGRVGAEAKGSATISPGNIDINLNAEIGASAEANVTNEYEPIDGVTMTDEVSASATAGAGVKGSASSTVGLDEVGASAYGGAHAGAEVGVGAQRSVGVGDSSAGGGAGVSAGPSVGIQGGGDFSIGSEGVSLGFAADLDLGVGLSINGNLDIKTDDVVGGISSGADAVEDVADDVVGGISGGVDQAEDIADDIGSFVGGGTSSVAKVIGSIW